MKFSAIASTLLLVGSSLAAPGTAIRRSRAQGRRSNLVQWVEAPADLKTNKFNPQYSSNWAGAVLIGTGYTSVTGTFTVPSPTSAGSGSAWVGIDGDTCETAILQTGIDWTRTSSGEITYDAWYEWYPDYAYDFTDITLAAGDTVTVTVTATSETGGTATVENVTTGQSVSHSFRNEGSVGSLCKYDAEWIVEDFSSDGSLVEFANFGTVEFTEARAIQDGRAVGVTGATLIDIKSGDDVLTDCTLSGSTGVTCRYV
ncbi:hypothetical protein BUE80_DR013547 [Diplocarpon rosae]|nr:hypothetical protein BUE80_DR013547 [Diplocarpon rosae]